MNGIVFIEICVLNWYLVKIVKETKFIWIYSVFFTSHSKAIYVWRSSFAIFVNKNNGWITTEDEWLDTK
jgi:hypothetical protein